MEKDDNKSVKSTTSNLEKLFLNESQVDFKSKIPSIDQSQTNNKKIDSSGTKTPTVSSIKTDTMLGKKRVKTNLFNFTYSNKGVKCYFVEILNSIIVEADKNHFLKDLLKNPKIIPIINNIFQSYISRGRNFYVNQPNETRNINELKTIPINFLVKDEETDQNIKDKSLEMIKKEEIFIKDPNYFSVKFIPKLDLTNASNPDVVEKVFDSNTQILNKNISLSLNEDKSKDENKTLIDLVTFCSNKIELTPEQNNIKQFLNILLKEAYKLNGFKKENLNLKQGFLFSGHEILAQNVRGKYPENNVPIYFKQAFCPKVINFSNLTCVQIIDKFVMTRDITYYEIFKEYYDEQSILEFEEWCLKNKNGHTIQNDLHIKISAVKFYDLSKLLFDQKGSNEKISVWDYFHKRYSQLSLIKSQKFVKYQPVLIVEHEIHNKSKKESQMEDKKIIQLNYFPSQLVQIRGKLEGDDFDISKKTIQNSSSKLSSINKFASDLQVKQKFKNIDPIFNFDLKQVEINPIVKDIPILEFADKKKFTPDKGNIEYEKYSPIENEKSIKPIIFFFDFDDTNNNHINVRYKLIQSFIETSSKINIKIEFDNNYFCNLSPDHAEQDFGNYITNLLINSDLLKERNCFLIVFPKKSHSKIYKDLKKTFHYYQSDANSNTSQVKKFRRYICQCLIIEKFDTDLFRQYGSNKLFHDSTYISIIYQMHCKLNQRVYKIHYKSYLGDERYKDIKDNVILGSYVVGKFIRGDVISFAGDIDFSSSQENTFFYNNFLDNSMNKINPFLEDHVEFLIKEYREFHTEEKNKNIICFKEYPKYLILFREYSQNIDKIVNSELLKLENLKSKYRNMQIYVIFVNKKSELRLFESYTKETKKVDLDETGIEFSEIETNEEKLYSIKNAQIGTIIDSTIVRNTERFKEFFLVSTNKENSIVIPTQYLCFCYRTSVDIINEKLNLKEDNKYYDKQVINNKEELLSNAIKKDKEFLSTIKDICFCQSFSGQNSFKSFKLPALLHFAYKMNGFIINNKIDNVPSKIKSNFSL